MLTGKEVFKEKWSEGLYKKRKEDFLTALAMSIKNDPTMSIRKRANELKAHERTVRTIIRQGLCPDLNPLDYAIWGILKNKTNVTSNLNVTYWPSTEPSIKRCICVNKRKNSEIGASGRRYRNITLTCGRGWIRCRCVRPQEAGGWSNNYIIRCHRRLEFSWSSSCSWSQLGTRCRIVSQR